MIKALNIFLVSFYSLGTLLLPVGDFSVLKDLPQMYRHCKATEDKNMGPMDFITDHLVNIDGIFDKHDNGDEQKPHTTPPSEHPRIHVFYPMSFPVLSIKNQSIPLKPVILYRSNQYSSGFVSCIFRPPIV